MGWEELTSIRDGRSRATRTVRICFRCTVNPDRGGAGYFSRAGQPEGEPLQAVRNYKLTGSDWGGVPSDPRPRLDAVDTCMAASENIGQAHSIYWLRMRAHRRPG